MQGLSIKMKVTEDGHLGKAVPSGVLTDASFGEEKMGFLKTERRDTWVAQSIKCLP